MDSSRHLSLIVGAFVIVSLSALCLGILSLTSEKGIFTERYRIVGEFDNVQGLLPGAPVWLAGKEIGRVDQVIFTAPGSEHPIRVELELDVEVQERVRSDSVARVGTIGVLGDSYIELQIGTPEGRIL
ncbi:MAG: MCE family protein, partial [Deltaproteobacteria bacterium]|nr:MCE family protein [Deltaproteobacteria bacterium]